MVGVYESDDPSLRHDRRSDVGVAVVGRREFGEHPRVARKLVEWAILRSDGTNSIDLRRYMAFINDNPSWPAVGLLRRRAEAIDGTLRVKRDKAEEMMMPNDPLNAPVRRN